MPKHHADSFVCPMHSGFHKPSKRGTAGCCLAAAGSQNASFARRLCLHAPSASPRLLCCAAPERSFAWLSDAATSHMSRPAATACLLTLTYLGKGGGSLTPCATWPSPCQQCSTLHPGQSVLSSGQRWVQFNTAFFRSPAAEASCLTTAMYVCSESGDLTAPLTCSVSAQLSPCSALHPFFLLQRKIAPADAWFTEHHLPARVGWPVVVPLQDDTLADGGVGANKG